jgi:hypothetical protein
MILKILYQGKGKGTANTHEYIKYMYLIITGFHHGAGSSILNKGVCHGGNAQIKKSLQRELGHYK